METKEHIRKEAIQKRKTLSLSDRMEKSDIILKYLMKTKEWNNAKNLLIYADFYNEVMTDKIILQAILQGKKVYLPKVNKKEIDFFRIYSLDDLRPGFYGIREPIDFEEEKIIPDQTEESILVIVPGTAFDKKGNRIGYGKGFYDRYLKKYQLTNTIGIAFSCQIYDEIPTDNFDWPIKQLITEA